MSNSQFSTLIARQPKVESTKVIDGFSACFRQQEFVQRNAKGLVSFKVWFSGEMDERNWVLDFGGFKRASAKIDGMNPSDYFKWLLDHTVIVAEDDPELELFKTMDERGLIQLRTLPHVGCERFALFLLDKMKLIYRNLHEIHYTKEFLV